MQRYKKAGMRKQLNENKKTAEIISMRFFFVFYNV